MADFVKNVLVGRFRLCCDNEPSIMEVAEKVKAKMLETVVVETPQKERNQNTIRRKGVQER